MPTCFFLFDCLSCSFSPKRVFFFFQRLLQSGKLTFWHSQLSVGFEFCVPHAPKPLECKLQSAGGERSGKIALVHVSPSAWHKGGAETFLSTWLGFLWVLHLHFTLQHTPQTTWTTQANRKGLINIRKLVFM